MRDIRKEYIHGEPKAIFGLSTLRISNQKIHWVVCCNSQWIRCNCIYSSVGENDYLTRKLVCENMDISGISLDESKNEAHEKGSGTFRNRMAK